MNDNGDMTTGDKQLDELVSRFLGGDIGRTDEQSRVANDSSAPFADRVRALSDHSIGEREFRRDWQDEADWPKVMELSKKLGEAFADASYTHILAAMGVVVEYISFDTGRCPKCLTDTVLYWALMQFDRQKAAHEATEALRKDIPPATEANFI